MRDAFELHDADAAGRIGRLTVPRADRVVETPALLPVVNPHVVTVDPSRFPEFGAEMIITNAYILHGSDDLRGEVLDRGVHDLLGFDGAIMTDSGSFQLSEYGDISVTTEEIVAFQREIGSDVATPVDIPTPPDAPREQAEDELDATVERIGRAAAMDAGEMLLTAPVQGSTYPDLRERAAREVFGLGDVYPVGATVPLMNDYRFADVVRVVDAAKRGLGESAPVHLFGAGHPMMFALAVAAGCDLFDSAAYALYARDDRYLTVRGTEHLADLDYLPCSCPVCSAHDPDGLRDLPDGPREERLAEHNLHVSFEEVRRIRQAVRAGDLLELVEARARSHPAMLDGYRALLDGADRLERADPVGKGTFFHLSAESARRPEVARHHDRLDRFEPAGRVLLAENPGAVDAGEYDEVWRVVPPFGPFPRALSQTYPLTAEVPDRFDAAAYRRAAEGIARLVETNRGAEFTLAHRGWPERALDALSDAVATVDLGS